MAEVMTVNQFAKWAGVAPHVIRYYARIGLLKPRRSASGYKLFAAAPAAMVNRPVPRCSKSSTNTSTKTAAHWVR